MKKNRTLKKFSATARPLMETRTHAQLTNL